MSSPLVTYVSDVGAQAALPMLSEEFALISNGPHVFPPFEPVPLAPRRTKMDDGLDAIFFDMDGTTTLTEDLCLFALEDLLRKILGTSTAEGWKGLNPKVDYPHIIGSSTSKNIEYLQRAYGEAVDERRFREAAVRALAILLADTPDPTRLGDLQADLAALGLANLAIAPEIPLLATRDGDDDPAIAAPLADLVARFAPLAALDSLGNRVRAGMAIYFARLHGMFERIAQGRGAEVARELYGPDATHAIRPLPGVGLMIALSKGWLREEAQALAPLLAAHGEDEAAARDALQYLGAHFAARPAHVALVTSSADYEAHIVLKEVFDGLRDEVAAWPVSEAVRERVLRGFTDHRCCYDAIVTASFSHEIRLKPYRDLYSIALHALGIPSEASHRVLGFEDTEAGIVAQRAAGLGVCCAVPFEGSRGHNFSAASHVLHAGFPEAIVRHRLFL